MKIFITGATGYIGSTVAEVLSKKGHDIIGLARSDRSAAKLAARGFGVHRGDITDSETLTVGARQADAVIHTAMPSPEEGLDLAEIGRIAAESTAALAAGLVGQNGIFIVTSGTGAYGDTGETVVDETTPIASGGPMAGIGLMEKQVLNGAADGVRGIVVRPSIVYGHGGSGPVLGMIQSIKQLGYAGFVAGADSHLSTVHVADLADLYALIIDQVPAGELFNAVGEIVPTKALMAAAQVVAGVNGDLRELSPQEAMQMGFVGSYLGGNMRVSAEKAKKVLGWQPKRASIVDDLKTGSYQAQLT